MKRLITILLLFIMAGQAEGIIFSTHSHLQYVLDTDEKNESETKETKKENKECVSHSLPLQIKPATQADFNITSINVASSPVIDHLAPPPDKAFAF